MATRKKVKTATKPSTSKATKAAPASAAIAKPLRKDRGRGRPSGRPHELTPDKEQRICQAIAMGMTYTAAAELAGISLQTLGAWRFRGEQGEEPFATLVSKIKKANAESQQRCLRAIEVQADHDWRAAAWILERRHPDGFAKLERREVSGPNGDPLKVEVASWADLVRRAVEDDK